MNFVNTFDMLFENNTTISKSLFINAFVIQINFLKLYDNTLGSIPDSIISISRTRGEVLINLMTIKSFIFFKIITAFKLMNLTWKVIYLSLKNEFRRENNYSHGKNSSWKFPTLGF